MHCRNQGTDIAQLAESYPSAQRPSLEPFSAQVLEQAFKLQPGKFALTEVSLGWTFKADTLCMVAPDQGQSPALVDARGVERLVN